MSVNDQKEYATGEHPNPLDIPADVPRQPDWQEHFLANREKKLEETSWYPKAVGAPETDIPRRYRAFEVDEGDFQASVSPQKWDCTLPIFVPLNDGLSGPPVEIVPFQPGRVSVTVVAGNNAIMLSPSQEAALNGRGVTITKNTTFTLNTQGAVWAWCVQAPGPSLVSAYWTAYESPTTHLPPKDKEKR